MLLYGIEVALFAAGGFGAVMEVVDAARRGVNLFLILVILGAFIVCTIVVYRILKRMTTREEVHVYKHQLILRKGNIFGKKSTPFLVPDIKNLHFIGYQKPVDHPLKSEHFDVHGMQTQMEVYSSIMAEGNIGFEHKGRLIRFGIGVPSWDASRLSDVICEGTDYELRITDIP